MKGATPLVGKSWTRRVTANHAWQAFVEHAVDQRELRPEDWHRLARFCAAARREGLDLYERERLLSEELRQRDFAGRQVRDILLVVMHSGRLYDALTEV